MDRRLDLSKILYHGCCGDIHNRLRASDGSYQLRDACRWTFCWRSGHRNVIYPFPTSLIPNTEFRAQVIDGCSFVHCRDFTTSDSRNTAGFRTVQYCGGHYRLIRKHIPGHESLGDMSDILEVGHLRHTIYSRQLVMATAIPSPDPPRPRPRIRHILLPPLLSEMASLQGTRRRSLDRSRQTQGAAHFRYSGPRGMDGYSGRIYLSTSGARRTAPFAGEKSNKGQST